MPDNSVLNNFYNRLLYEAGLNKHRGIDLNITPGYRSPDVIDSRWYPTAGENKVTRSLYPVLDVLPPGNSMTVAGSTYTRPPTSTPTNSNNLLHMLFYRGR